MTNLDLSIQSLKEYTLRMIEKCEDAVDLSIEYTLKKDIRGLKKLIRQDDDIDILREYIRDRSIELMALKQPLARDLRYIYALSDISTELERIGDYSTNIAMQLTKIAKKNPRMIAEEILKNRRRYIYKRNDRYTCNERDLCRNVKKSMGCIKK